MKKQSKKVAKPAKLQTGCGSLPVRTWDSETANEITERLCRSYALGYGVSYRDLRPLPERDVVIQMLEGLYDLLFPGEIGRAHV